MHIYWILEQFFLGIAGILDTILTIRLMTRVESKKRLQFFLHRFLLAAGLICVAWSVDPRGIHHIYNWYTILFFQETFSILIYLCGLTWLHSAVQILQIGLADASTHHHWIQHKSIAFYITLSMFTIYMLSIITANVLIFTFGSAFFMSLTYFVRAISTALCSLAALVAKSIISRSFCRHKHMYSLKRVFLTRICIQRIADIAKVTIFFTIADLVFAFLLIVEYNHKTFEQIAIVQSSKGLDAFDFGFYLVYVYLGLIVFLRVSWIPLFNEVQEDPGEFRAMENLEAG